MTDTNAARRALDWLIADPGRYIPYSDVYIPDGVYPEGQDVPEDTVLSLSGGAALPEGTRVSAEAAVVLTNGWTLRGSNTTAIAVSPDGEEVIIRQAAGRILDTEAGYIRDLQSNKFRICVEALKAMADGTSYGQYTRQYKPDVAQQILDLFDQYPRLHRQSRWFDSGSNPDGTERQELPPAGPEVDYPCGTTMCVAGAACHVTGYTLHAGAFVSKDGENGEPIYRAARIEMGLTTRQADWLFDADRTNSEVKTTLRTIAAGGHPDFA
jgi:hypothetical protein